MGKIFVLVGPSGSGKTTLGRHLKDMGLAELVSHTTRDMRANEIEGVTYYFISEDEFEKLDKVESVRYSGKNYALARSEVDNKLAAYKNVFVIVDVMGLRQLKEIYKDKIVSIFIEVTLAEMMERMARRGDSDKTIMDRVHYALGNSELEQGHMCDYTIRNDDIQVAKDSLEKIIQKEVNMC